MPYGSCRVADILDIMHPSAYLSWYLVVHNREPWFDDLSCYWVLDL